MTEEWRIIDGFYSYEISDLGRVRRRTYVGRNTVAGAILKLFRSASGRGYPTITLCKPGTKRKVGVHVLVCTAFHGPAPSPFHEVAHGNGDKTDCRKDNLRWATKAENSADKLLHGSDNRGQKHGASKLSDADAEFIRRQPRHRGPGRALAARFGVSESLICMIRTGRVRSFPTPSS